jgi:hypothetical protein
VRYYPEFSLGGKKQHKTSVRIIKVLSDIRNGHFANRLDRTAYELLNLLVRVIKLW